MCEARKTLANTKREKESKYQGSPNVLRKYLLDIISWRSENSRIETYSQECSNRKFLPLCLRNICRRCRFHHCTFVLSQLYLSSTVNSDHLPKEVEDLLDMCIEISECQSVSLVSWNR